MYYDDGYEELLKVEKEESNIPKARVYKLNDNDVISVNNLLLEFENNILYEVVKRSDGFFAKYERTGRSFTPQEINKMFT